MDTEFKNIVQRLKIYDIFVLDPYGEKITEFGDYATLYIQIPDNYDEKDLKAIHINEDKDQEFDEWIETIDGKKYLVFNTNHFSPYAILDKNTNSYNFLIYIFISINIMLVVILFYRKV